jgi:hypothetical protein
MISEAAGGSRGGRRARSVKSAVTSNIRALPEPAASERSIKDLLTDVRAPQTLLAWMAPLLEDVGCTVSETIIRDPFGGLIERQVSVIERGSGSAYLIVVPRHVLNAPSGEALEAMSYFETMFRSESSKVLICSEALDALHAAFMRMLQGWENVKSVAAHFVPWRALTDIWDTKDPADLVFALSLDKLLPSAGNLTPLSRSKASPPSDQLTPEEIRLVATELADLARVHIPGPEAYFRRLIGELELPAGRQDLGQLPREDTALLAKKLVEWLAVHGQYPPDHRYAECRLVGILILELTQEVGVGQLGDRLANIARHRQLLSSEQADKLPPPSQGS